MNNSFFEQHPIPINTSDVDWNILNIPEVATHRVDLKYHRFETTRHLSTKDLMDFFEQHEQSKLSKEEDGSLADVLNKLNFVTAQMRMSDLKEKCLLEDIEKIRQEIVSVFSEEIENVPGNVVQFVKTPLTFLEFAPGDTSIKYKLFTERCLGDFNE